MEQTKYSTSEQVVKTFVETLDLYMTGESKDYNVQLSIL